MPDGRGEPARGSGVRGAAETELMRAGCAGAADDETPDPDVRARSSAITPFRRLWLALGFSSLGDWLGLLAITALADQLARGNTAHEYLAIAGVFILRLAAGGLLGPLAGALADRSRAGWTLVYGDVLRFAILATIPLRRHPVVAVRRDAADRGAWACSGCRPRTRRCPTSCRASGSRRPTSSA